jgi:hypothetical protein
VTWVHDRIYAGGGGQIPDGWDSFAEQTGVAAVLHLCPKKPARFRGRPPTAFLWLDIEGEREAGAAERWLAGRFVESCLDDGLKVLLHSSLGRHRTRWAYVAYRIVSGRSAHAALREAAERPWLSPYATDAASWEDFADQARARRSEGGGRAF